MVRNIVDLSQPHKELDYYEKGQSTIDPESRGADWIEQDGYLYCWSASNLQYELAWWLYTTETTPLVVHLKETRKPPIATI